MRTGIILCGGRSTRMGQDKGSIILGGETMVERIARILGSITNDVIVVGRRDQAVATVHDGVEDQGPLAGIAAGLSATKSDLNIVVACDMPLINAAVLERLASMIGESDMCVAVNDGHPSVLCGVYRSRVAPIAQRLFDSGERRVMALLDRVAVTRVDANLLRDLDPHLQTFLSVDTPESLETVSKQFKST